MPKQKQYIIPVRVENSAKLPEKASDLLPVSEAAKHFKYTASYLSLRIRQHKIKGEKINNKWHTKLSWIEDYIASGADEPAQEKPKEKPVKVQVKDTPKQEQKEEQEYEEQEQDPIRISLTMGLVFLSLIIIIFLFVILPRTGWRL